MRPQVTAPPSPPPGPPGPYLTALCHPPLPPHQRAHHPVPAGRTCMAFSHCPPLSHALMAALVMVVSGRTPSVPRLSNTSNPFCQLPSRVSWLTSLVRPEGGAQGAARP